MDWDRMRLTKKKHKQRKPVAENGSRAFGWTRSTGMPSSEAAAPRLNTMKSDSTNQRAADDWTLECMFHRSQISRVRIRREQLGARVPVKRGKQMNGERGKGSSKGRERERVSGREGESA
eukprot:6208022-Pleurochrysis_carterae.AAC.2